jgi:predicted nucleic acid-binding protein
MTHLMVDTDVFSYLHKKDPIWGAPYRPHLQGHVLTLSFATVGELYAGYLQNIERGQWPESRLEELESNLQLTTVVPYNREVCKAFGRLSTLKGLDGASRAMQKNDQWIAACAICHSLTLVTNNRRHFENIPGLTIICEAPGTRPRKTRPSASPSAQQ